MKIEELDKNFKKEEITHCGNIYDVPSEYVNLFGVSYDKEFGFHRMPIDISSKVSPNVNYLQFHTAGGRIAFSTDSKIITIHVKYPALEKMYHMALTGQAGFALCEVVNGQEQHVHTYRMTFDDNNGFVDSSRAFKKSKMRDFVLHMPLYNKVSELKLEIEEGSSIKPFNPYKNIKPVLYYGSSITQGGCASRSDHSYQDFICKWNMIDYINLGFSGNCKGEKEMSKYISSIDCSVFVYDYDHNTPNPEHLKETHEPLFLEFRKSHPNTPVIFLSAPNFYVDPSIYRVRRKIVKETYLNAIAAGDKNVYFIDGATIYPKKFRYECTVDESHPTELGFYFFAKKIYAILKRIGLD